VHLAPEGVDAVDFKQVGSRERSSRKIKLECRSCHQLDQAGRYMLPIQHDQHCKGCHPLFVQLQGEFESSGLTALAAHFAARPAPHAEPIAVRAVLRQRLVELAPAFTKKAPAMASAELPRTLPSRPKPLPVNAAEWSWVNEQLETAERQLFQGAAGCRYCHASAVEWSAGLPRYPPSAINKRAFPAPIGASKRWMPKSVFNHHAHRMVQCADCHAAENSEKTSDVLLPGIDSCMNCHRPNGGARSGCVECHQYHAREKTPTWKLGSPTRQARAS
jgi:hypothetical protein